MTQDFDLTKEVLEVFKTSDERWKKYNEEQEERQKKYNEEQEERRKKYDERRKKMDEEWKKSDERWKKLSRRIRRDTEIYLYGYVRTRSERRNEKINKRINKNISKFIENKFKECIIHKIFYHDWNVVRSKYSSKYSRHKYLDIYLFDHLYIITNDETYDAALLNTDDPSKGVLYWGQKGLFRLDEKFPMYWPHHIDVECKKFYQFVVVEETKLLNESLTETCVKNKIEQMFCFKNYIKELCDDPQQMDEFRFIVQKFKLQFFIDQPIHLVFTSPNIDENCINFIKNEASSWMKDNIHVSCITSIQDDIVISSADEDFVPRTIVFSPKQLYQVFVNDTRF
jgi:hypothetical protein